MNFSGRAITKSERDRLLAFAGVSSATDCCIGSMMFDDGLYHPVARFFNNDKYLFYVQLSEEKGFPNVRKEMV